MLNLSAHSTAVACAHLVIVGDNYKTFLWEYEAIFFVRIIRILQF